MRYLIPYNTTRPVACLPAFYRRRIRDGRTLYGFMVGYRPGAAPVARRPWWRRWLG